MNTDSWKDFTGAADWVDGSIQEIITDKGETLKDVANFARMVLEITDREDLFFWEHEIAQEGEKFYVRFRARSLEGRSK